VDPVSRVICGVPVTVTDSEKFTCTEMEPPALYDPFAVDADTDDTVGAVMSLLSLSENIGYWMAVPLKVDQLELSEPFATSDLS